MWECTKWQLLSWRMSLDGRDMAACRKACLEPAWRIQSQLCNTTLPQNLITDDHSHCTLPCAACRLSSVRPKLASRNEVLFEEAPTLSCYRVTDTVGML